MMMLLSASTETIIGIVAIIVIVISAGIIVATAVRNFLLQKKMNEQKQEGNIVEIELETQGAEEQNNAESKNPLITEEDEEAALQTKGIEEEFGDQVEEEEIMQEIDFANKADDENGKMVGGDIEEVKVQSEEIFNCMEKD